MLQRPRTKLLSISYALESNREGNLPSCLHDVWNPHPPLPIGLRRLDKDSNTLTNNVIAIDSAKNVFQACHISVHGELLSNKPLSRQKMKEFLAKAKPSIVGKRTKLISNKY